LRLHLLELTERVIVDQVVDAIALVNRFKTVELHDIEVTAYLLALAYVIAGHYEHVFLVVEEHTFDNLLLLLGKLSDQVSVQTEH